MNPLDLGELFQTFGSSAFRLETLPHYRIESEAEALRLFRTGHPEPEWRKDRPWLATVRAARERSATMQRVRMVDRPLTEYQRYQFEWGYVANEQAGEQIYILDYEPLGLLPLDFWLFDDNLAVVLEYDDAGRFLRPVVAETLAPYRQARDMALKASVPFREYKRRLAVG